MKSKKKKPQLLHLAGISPFNVQVQHRSVDDIQLSGKSDPLTLEHCRKN
jgi:hypothetical protein